MDPFEVILVEVRRDLRRVALKLGLLTVFVAAVAFAGNWMWRAYIWHHVSDLIEERYGLEPLPAAPAEASDSEGGAS